MGGCVSSHAASVRSASLPSSAVQSPNPQSPDVLCHGLQTRTTSESQSDSSSCPQTADGNGLLTGNKRSSLSTDMEQLQAVYEQQHDSLCPLPPHHSLTAVPATFCQRQLHAASLAVDAADEFNSRSASPDELDRPYLPPPPPAPIAVYRLRDDDDDEDDDSEGDEADEDGKLDELELISEEQVFAAARDSFDDDQSISTAPIGTRRISLLASAPPGASISSSLSSLDSPHSMERRLTVTVSVGSFHVLLVDEDEQHAQLIARWLRKKQFVVTVCADGEEAVSLMQEIYEVSRARHSFMASSHTFSHHSQQLLDPSDERLSVSSSAADSATQLHDIDLIICDACMNGTDGQPFLDYCKQSPAFAHVPIVLMSVDVESAAVNRSINRGAYDHWAKPLARPLLQNTVRVIREGKKEERKASLLREWGDRYKQTMLEERKAAIGQGHQPHTLSATPLTSLRSAMLLTPLAPSSRVLPPLNGAMGGWSAAASYGQLMAHEGRTFAVVLSTSDDEQHNEQDRLREWLGELHVEHSVVGSVAAVSQRVERMVRSRDRLAPTKKRGKSWQTNSFQSPMPVARIQEEKEAEQTSTDSSGDSTARRRDEANREKVKGIIGLMRQHSRSQTSGGLAEQFMDRDVDLLIVDLDELDDSGLTECYQLLEKATDKAVSIIVMSDSSSTFALPSHADIDAVLQKPVRKETFCTKVSAIIARRQARLHSSVLAQRAEGYKEMVDKIRQKRASQLPNNATPASNTSPPSKTVSVGTGINGRYHDETADVMGGRERSGSQPDERLRGEKLMPLERTPSLPLVKLHGEEEEKEASDDMSAMRLSVFPPTAIVKQLLQPLHNRAASAQHRLQQLDGGGDPIIIRRALSVNKPLEHGSLRTPKDEDAGRRLSST